MKFQCGNAFPLSMDWGYSNTFYAQQPTLPLADEENQVCVLGNYKELHAEETITHSFN